jgi:hypothetical protein
MRARRLLVIALAVAANAAARVGAAQDSVSAPAPTRIACLDAIPDSALRRVPVYLVAVSLDSSSPRPPLHTGIDWLTQGVAQTGRTLLGGPEGVLPHGEPVVDWRSLDGDVLVVARRDGRIEGRVMPPIHAGAAWKNDAGSRFVARALDTAYARGERLLLPDSLPSDSVAWRFHLESSLLNERGDVTPPKVRLGIPMFSVMAPAERQVSAERVRVRYPERLRRSGFVAKVLMQFVVDTAGRVDSTTVRDLLPPGQLALDPKDRPVYDEFIGAILLGLKRATYRPATIGGCLVRQMVQQPFTFSPGDGPRPPDP